MRAGRKDNTSSAAPHRTSSTVSARIVNFILADMTP